ncbi:hypothetical protein PR048_014230 [Dryococelus australis]|uniref:Uncharacterized protein n=1 Tax=Dryococelus australis TaxID=614101 RepID=A0ABQ9HDK9_9NEOP|nr:hypothetical protein PR048_014230 [Dryococelus australis]
MLGIVPDDAVARRDFSGIPRFPRPFIPVVLRTHLDHPQLPKSLHSLINSHKTLKPENHFRDWMALTATLPRYSSSDHRPSLPGTKPLRKDLPCGDEQLFGAADECALLFCSAATDMRIILQGFSIWGGIGEFEGRRGIHGPQQTASLHAKRLTVAVFQLKHLKFQTETKLTGNTVSAKRVNCQCATFLASRRRSNERPVYRYDSGWSGERTATSHPVSPAVAVAHDDAGTGRSSEARLREQLDLTASCEWLRDSCGESRAQRSHRGERRMIHPHLVNPITARLSREWRPTSPRTNNCGLAPAGAY